VSPKGACATCSPKGACAVCARKALNQREGGAASFPLIQRFSDVRRGVSINTSANLQVDVDVVVELCYPLEHKYFILLKLNSKHNLWRLVKGLKHLANKFHLEMVYFPPFLRNTRSLRHRLFLCGLLGNISTPRPKVGHILTEIGIIGAELTEIGIKTSDTTYSLVWAC
jgi:hypothetical protein